jgi:flagellum-specific ATP synthase
MMLLKEKDSQVINAETNFEKIMGGISKKILSRTNIEFSGTVTAYDGQVIESSQFPASIGSECTIESRHGTLSKGEIIGFKDDKNIIFLYEKSSEIFNGDKVFASSGLKKINVGPNLLGRVIDGLGAPLDGHGPIDTTHQTPVGGVSVNPFDRGAINQVFDVGIKSINAITSIGRGQRMGIIAGSGVGKSVLLSMITRSAEADVIVVGLIGERGRELASFTKEITTSHSKHKVVIVAVPADRSALLRIQGAKRATSIAEYFRDQGKNVLLILDSLTRVAHAQREIGLSMGEQPTARGYPPSVISLIPELIERTGVGVNSLGSITSIYTILADGDDTVSDPIVDNARAILDGHIVLSRKLAQQGIYPAVDVSSSVSRLMGDLCSPKHLQNARKLRKLISIYQENQDLLLMGGYIQGQDADLDLAVQLWPKIVSFLHQDQAEAFSLSQTEQLLADLLG